MAYALGTSTIDITAGSEDLTTVVSALGASAGTVTSSSGVSRVVIALPITVAAGATLTLLPNTSYDFGSLSRAIQFAGTVIVGEDDGTLNPTTRTHITHDFEQGQNYNSERGLFDPTATTAQIGLYGVSGLSNSTLGTTLKNDQCRWVARGCTFVNVNTDDDHWRIASGSRDLDFTNVRLYGGSLFPSQAFARFDGVSIDSPRGAAITFDWGDPTYNRHVFSGFEVRNAGTAVLALMAGNTTTAPKGYQIDLRNVPSDVTGTENQVNPRAGSWANGRSVGSVVKTFDLTVNAAAFGGGALDVKYVIEDSDSRNRTSGSETDNAIDVVTSETIRHNFNLNLIWSGTATSGVIAEVIYSAAFARPKSHYTSSPSVAPIWDVRLPVSVKTWQYGYLPQQTSITSVTGAVAQNITYFVDPLISEANASTVAAYTEADTAQKAYDLMHLHVDANFGGETDTIVKRVDDTLDALGRDVVIDATATQLVSVTPTTITFKAGTFTGNLKTKGTVTLSNGAAITGSIEDSAGVRVRIDIGGTGNILARRTDTSTEFAFATGVTSATYTVPKGVTIEYSAWRLGYDTAHGSISTAAGGKVVTPNWIAEEAVDTALDVSVFLSDITVSLAPAQYNITFDAAMTANLEQIKAVIHRLFGREVSLRALLGNNGTRSLRIKSDEITILLPVVFFHRGTSLAATDRVDMRSFFNTDVAIAVSGSYLINPSMSDGLYVAVLPVKPALDVGQLADAVEDRLGANITAARDHSRAANVQTQV